MNKNLITLLCLGMFLISLGSAQITDLGIFKQGTNITLIQTCASCTYNNITSIKLGNGTTLFFSEQMTKNGIYYYWDLNSSYTDSLGKYSVTGVGDLSGTDTIWSYGFEVTYYGQEISTAQSILYGFFFFIFIFFMITLFFIINKLPTSNTKDEQGRILSISYLKYLRSAFWFVEWMLVMGLLYVSSNLAFAYMQDQLFAQILFTLFSISFRFTPVIVIVWVIWIIVKMFHDKELQRILNRGIFPQGRL